MHHGGILPFEIQESTKEAVVRGNLARLKEDLVDGFGGWWLLSLKGTRSLVRVGRTNRRVELIRRPMSLNESVV